MTAAGKFVLGVLSGSLLFLIVSLLTLWSNAAGPLAQILIRQVSPRLLAITCVLLAMAVLISVALNILQALTRRRSLGERYPFDDKRGYNVDSKDRPLCPGCLRDGHVSRLAMQNQSVGYCNACRFPSKGILKS